MAHDHTHGHEELGDGRVLFAIALNLLLTVVEVAAGVISGSLSLVADALHNFSDCASLLIALAARRIGRRPSDQQRTFGYRRAEIIGALINLTALAIVGLYLIYEAMLRLLEPRAIDGAIVIGVALLALAVDLGTAGLLWKMSRGNLNLRAAFLHNLTDALHSLGVILAGVVVLWWNAYWFDAALTLVIAGYILVQSLTMMARSVHILMESVPVDIALNELTSELQSIAGVIEIHHVHVWELDERHRALEAHVVVATASHAEWAAIKQDAKNRLRDRFHISHSTLEFETVDEPTCDECPPGQC